MKAEIERKKLEDEEDKKRHKIRVEIPTKIF